MKCRIFAGVIASLAVVSVAWATQAHADAAPTAVNPVAIAQSLRSQLEGNGAFQFAISVDGHLELTGSDASSSSLPAVAALRNGALGGDSTSCHIELGSGIEAVLLVATPQSTQPCGLLGLAYAAAT